MRLTVCALAAASLTFGIVTACAGGGSTAGSGNHCNEECLAQCRAECTDSPGSDSYDECTESCDCGCGD
ncbi:MAG TPA: hypothetical protein VMS55_24200 [Myxococcota bacterium]|nr:hypothetical protein [Myxococcota bacterium]